MKKLMITLGLTALIGALLAQSGVAYAAVVFLLTGVIPSTDYSVPPIAMFALMAICLWLLFAAISQDWIRKNIDHPQPERPLQAPSRPHRRYTRVKA